MARKKTGAVDQRSDDERLWDRIMAHVKKDRTNGCWHWTSYRDGKGYARLWPSRYAHIELLRLAGKTRRDGYLWHRRCQSDDCVRPEHYDAVTREVVWATSPAYGFMQRTKTQCIHGHEFDEANTYHVADGTRRCRACRKAADKRRIRTRRKTPATVS